MDQKLTAVFLLIKFGLHCWINL